MKTKDFLIMTGLLLASCSNNNDFFPSIDNDCDWETSLNEIITDNDDLFANRGIKITSIKFIDNVNIDKNLFFGDQYGVFPVYSKMDSVFTILTYNQLMKDSNNYCFDTTVVIRKINELLIHSDDYDVVELSWDCGNNTYNSMAFFNKRTGELEYDNMLYNMSTISSYEKEGFSRALAIAESGVGDSGSDYVEYKTGNTLIAKSGVNWTVNGTWSHQLYLEDSDPYFLYYNVYSTFTVSGVSLSPISYVLPGSDGDVFFDKRDLSAPGSSTYSFRYAIWAGPQGSLNLNQTGNYTAYNIFEPPFLFESRIGAGNGRLVEKTKMVQPKTDFLIVPRD